MAGRAADARPSSRVFSPSQTLAHHMPACMSLRVLDPLKSVLSSLDKRGKSRRGSSVWAWSRHRARCHTRPRSFRGASTPGDFYCGGFLLPAFFLPYSINRRRGVVLGSEPFTVSTLRHDHCAGVRASSSCRRSARTSAPACTRRRPARVPDERSWNLAFRWLGLFLAVLSVVMPNDMPLDPEHGTRAGGAKASGGCSRHPRFPAFHRSGLRQAAAIVHRSPLTSARFDWNGRPRKPQTNRSKDSLFPVSFRLFIFVTTIAIFHFPEFPLRVER